MGLDSINPAGVMITVPPCLRVTEQETVREERGHKGEEEEAEVPAVGTMKRRRAGGVEIGLRSFFNTHLADVRP